MIRTLKDGRRISDWEYRLLLKQEYIVLVDLIRDSEVYQEDEEFRQNFDSWWEFNQDCIGFDSEKELLDHLGLLLAKYNVL